MISPTYLFHPPPTPHFKAFQVILGEEKKIFSLIEMQHQAIRLQHSYFANYAVLVVVTIMCVLLKMSGCLSTESYVLVLIVAW
jgi:hypothetical protein